MSDHTTNQPILHPVALTAARPQLKLRSYIAITAISFSLLGVLAGLGLAWLMMPPAQVTVVREAPRVNSRCTQTLEHRTGMGSLIWINESPSSETETKTETETEAEAENKATGLRIERHGKNLFIELRAGGSSE